MAQATECKVGFEDETLVRVVDVAGSHPYRSLEVVAIGRASGPQALRTRLAIAGAALRARHLGGGFAITSAEDARTLARALGGDGELRGVEPMSDGDDRYVRVGTCSDGCVVHIRAWAPDDDAGWISVGFLSPAGVRRDCSLRGRAHNAVAALAGRSDWTAWDPITEPEGLLGALADASALAFPHNRVPGMG